MVRTVSIRVVRYPYHSFGVPLEILNHPVCSNLFLVPLSSLVFGAESGALSGPASRPVGTRFARPTNQRRRRGGVRPSADTARLVSPPTGVSLSLNTASLGDSPPRAATTDRRWWLTTTLAALVAGGR